MELLIDFLNLSSERLDNKWVKILIIGGEDDRD
jgi:hypothetical protein